jgi:hypothetical protein
MLQIFESGFITICGTHAKNKERVQKGVLNMKVKVKCPREECNKVGISRLGKMFRRRKEEHGKKLRRNTVLTL